MNRRKLCTIILSRKLGIQFARVICITGNFWEFLGIPRKLGIQMFSFWTLGRYLRYLPSVQKENIIAWFITVIWIKKYLKLLSEKIIIPLLRPIFLNYMNQKLKLLWFQSLSTFCEERADNPILLVKNMLYSSQVRCDCSKAMQCTPTCESEWFEIFLFNSDISFLIQL